MHHDPTFHSRSDAQGILAFVSGKEEHTHVYDWVIVHFILRWSQTDHDCATCELLFFMININKKLVDTCNMNLLLNYFIIWNKQLINRSDIKKLRNT